METIEQEKEIKAYIKEIFVKNMEALKEGKDIALNDIFTKKAYMDFYQKMHKCTSNTSEIQNCYNILKIELSKSIDQMLNDLFRDHRSEYITSERIMTNLNQLMEMLKKITRMMKRFFHWFDKKKMQCTNFIDETSAELINNKFFDECFIRQKHRLFEIIKEVSMENLFKECSDEYKRFLSNMNYFLTIYDRKRTSFLEELIKWLITLIDEELKNTRSTLHLEDPLTLINEVNTLNTILTKNVKKGLPEDNNFNNFRDKFFDIVDMTLVDAVRQSLTCSDFSVMEEILNANDHTNLQILVSLLQQNGKDKLSYLREPFREFMLRKENSIIDQYINDNDKLISELIRFFKTCNTKIKKVMGNDSDILFARNKAIEQIMHEKKKIGNHQVNVSDLLVESLLRFTLLHIHNSDDKEGISETMVKEEFEPIVDMLSYMDTKYFFNEFNMFFANRMINLNNLKKLDFEKHILKVFEEKLGESVIYNLKSVYNEIKRQEEKKEAFEEFKKRAFLSNKAEFNVTQICSKEIKKQTEYRLSKDFLFYTNFYSSYFHSDANNANKKFKFSLDLGYIESEYEINGKVYTLIGRPIYVVILMYIAENEKASVRELIATLITKESPNEDVHESMIEKLEKLINTGLLLKNENEYRINLNFNQIEPKIIIGDTKVYKQEAQKESFTQAKAVKKYEYKSKIMKVLKNYRQMSIREVEEFIGNSVEDFSIDKFREAVSHLLEKEFLLRHHQKKEVLIFK